ncbi:MAG: uracil-DNA glycosylase [Verrucomicrobia bacterium]|nr:uracil-DNA glycosylase [Verrucomicrobiota bacterium]
MKDSFKILNQEIVSCRLCPRLVKYREGVEPKLIFADQTYWKKPIPGFGDEKGWLLIVGLAPSPHGGNRTGRIFTGDLSAKFLFQCLYDVGLANQPLSESVEDGLQLNGCYLTAAVKCVPPLHKPTPKEIRQCSQYFYREFDLLKNLKAILVLGQIAFNALKFDAAARGYPIRGIRFAHGARYDWFENKKLYASYHPSPQNTNTGKMTAQNFKSLLKEIQEKRE